MLSGPRQLASAEQTFGYFLHEYLARNDGSHRSANRWHGEGAEALGLGQRVGKRKFISILSGEVPGTDITLGRVIDGERQHRPGWDMTFSAPKSVSLEALYRGRRAVMHAHDEAVRATLDWIEREHLQTRGYDPATGRRPREAADGMVAATFRHMASRNNDPQLHTHAVVANMTRNRSGEWRSVEPTLLRRNRRVFGAWYRNDLARRLRGLGYELVPTTVGGLPSFEIAGWSREWLEAFSTRRQDILRYMEDAGLEYTTANAQAATLATRGKKVEPVKGELVKLWRQRAEALGLVEARRDRKARPDRAPEQPRLSPLEAVWQATAHLEERRCVFRRTDLLAAALGRDPGRHSHGELEAAIDRLRGDRNLVDTKSGDLTTRRTLEAERDVIAAMREGRGRAAPLANERDVAARLETASLTDGQRDAVRTILQSKDSIVGVQGFAGTGKTRMLKEVVRLAGDRLVIGLAPSSAAARVMALEAGIGTTTLQWMLARYGDLGDAGDAELREARERFRGAVIVVDEASMVGTVQMRSLQNVAERIGAARLALVGDRLQLRSVEAGQPFRLLQEAGMETARMDDILRQRSVDLKAAVTHMVAGDADLAIQSLGGDVKELPPDRLPETAANLWLALPPEARRRTVILAPTHAQREETTAVLRKGLAEEGVLGGRTLETERFVDRRLTRVLAADPQSYRPGDVVVANRDVYGLGKGEAWRVTGSGEDGIALERRGARGGFRPSGNASHNVSVFETRPISLRAGDEIVFTRNLGGPGVVNGERGAIEEIGRKRVRIRLDGGRRLTFKTDDDGLRHVDHAWTSTVHRAQGLTTDNVIAVLDATSMMTDRALLYVEMSRARDGFVLLTDDTQELVHRLEQEIGVSHSALEATGHAVRHLEREVSRKEPLRPALQEWRKLEAEAERDGISPFLAEEADALLDRLRERAEAEGGDAPEEIARILADHDAHVGGQDREALEDMLQHLRSRAASEGRNVAVQPGAGAVLKMAGELSERRPEALPKPLADFVSECGTRMRELGDRLDRVGPRLRRAERELSAIENDWLGSRIKAGLKGEHVAFLPETDALLKRTADFALEHTGALPKATADAARACESLRQRWGRLQRVAKEVGNGLDGSGAPGKAARKAMAEAENLLRDGRLSGKAEREGIRVPLTAALGILNARLSRQELIGDLQRDREALMAEARRERCHPYRAPGYGRFMERLGSAGHDLPPDLAGMVREMPKLDARDREIRQGVREVTDFVARRREIIDSAARRRPDRPLGKGRVGSYGRWTRSAPKMIERGERLARDPLLTPDDRKTLEKALARLHAAPDTDALDARSLKAWEGILDRAEEQGCHRFFVEGYDAFVEELDSGPSRSPGFNMFVVGERSERWDMQAEQARLRFVDRDLAKALRERDEGGRAFVAEMHPYPRWKREAERSVGELRDVLSDRERFDRHLARVPGLERRLRETAAAVSDTIRRDAPVRKEVEAAYEREMERERELERIRNPSRYMGAEIDFGR